MTALAHTRARNKIETKIQIRNHTSKQNEDRINDLYWNKRVTCKVTVASVGGSHSRCRRPSQPTRREVAARIRRLEAVDEAGDLLTLIRALNDDMTLHNRQFHVVLTADHRYRRLSWSATKHLLETCQQFSVNQTVFK